MNDLERSLAFKPTPDDIDHIRALPPERLPKFAVVIPSFNQAKYIGGTLDSVLAQDYPRMEVFVADGASKDGSVEIIADYASRHPDLIHYDTRPDGGHQFGVNKGIASTDGEIIAWINSDDLYAPDAFWKVAAFFYFNRNALVVYGRNNYVNDDLDVVAEYPTDWSPVIREQVRRMMHFCLPPQPSLFFRRMAVTLCGALNHKVLDYELWLRWQENLPFYFIDDLLSLSRLQKDAISVNADEKLMLQICDVVHMYYGVVPYSWTLRYAMNRAHGAAWARGEAPPVTRAIRLDAWRIWAKLNLVRAPRSIGRSMSNVRKIMSESFRASS